MADQTSATTTPPPPVPNSSGGVAPSRLLKPSPYFLSQRVGRWQWPWFLLGLAAMTVAVMTTFVVIFASVEILQLASWDWAVEAGSLIDSALEGDSITSPDALAIALVVGIGIPFWVAAIAGTLVQGRSVRSLIAPIEKIRWPIVGTVLIVEALVFLAIALVDVVALGGEYEFAGFDRNDAIWLGPILLAVLVQTSGEDVLFKGYLFRQLGAATKIFWLAPALIVAFFVSLHLGNGDTQSAPLLIFTAFVLSDFAIIYLLMRTGGMEVPLVMHWTNNAFIFLVIAERKTQSNDLTLFVFDDDPTTISDDAVVVGAFLVGLAAKMVAFTWKRSPFYLERHPGLTQVPLVLGEESTVGVSGSTPPATVEP